MNLFRSISVLFAISLLQGATLAQEQLTEVERLRWELVVVKSQLHAALAERDGCRAQLVPVRGDAVKAELAQLQQAIEAAHAGFTFNVATGTLEPKPRAETERPK